MVRVFPEHDKAVLLIDETKDQDHTDYKGAEDIRAAVSDGLVAEAEPMSEAMAGNSIPGNNGKVFFNCPSQVPAGDPK